MIHHATKARADKNGVIIKETEDGTVQAHHPKTNKRVQHEDAKIALNLALLYARFGTEYRVSIEADGPHGHVLSQNERLAEFDALDFDAELVFSEALDKAAEIGLDIEAPETVRPVVPTVYRERYKAAGHPRNNGDDIAMWAADTFTVIVEGIEAFDVEAFDMMLLENGVELVGPWQAMKDENTRGWQGRYRMNGGQKLRVAVGQNGKLVHRGETVNLPADYVAALVQKQANKQAKKG